MVENTNYFQNFLNQLSKFGLVGVISNILGYLIYLLITFLGLKPELAITFLYPIGAVIGYYGNKNYTFTYKGDLRKSKQRYIISHIAGYFINILMIYIFVNQFNYPHQLIQAIAILIIAIYLFLMMKFFIFKNTKK